MYFLSVRGIIPVLYFRCRGEKNNHIACQSLSFDEKKKSGTCVIFMRVCVEFDFEIITPLPPPGEAPIAATKNDFLRPRTRGAYPIYSKDKGQCRVGNYVFLYIYICVSFTYCIYHCLRSSSRA